MEPFTIITIETRALEIIGFSEFIWDGVKKHFRALNPGEAFIWSSVTLYNEKNRQFRRQWFNRFITEKNGNISPENILGFHGGKHTGDSAINVIMEREGGLKTVSITQVVPGNGKLRMNYFDLHNQQNSSLEI